MTGLGPIWVVPVEMALALAPPDVVATVLKRRVAGDAPGAHAKVLRMRGALYATLSFGPGRELRFHLSAPLAENA